MKETLSSIFQPSGFHSLKVMLEVKNNLLKNFFF